MSKDKTGNDNDNFYDINEIARKAQAEDADIELTDISQLFDDYDPDTDSKIKIVSSKEEGKKFRKNSDKYRVVKNENYEVNRRKNSNENFLSGDISARNRSLEKEKAAVNSAAVSAAASQAASSGAEKRSLPSRKKKNSSESKGNKGVRIRKTTPKSAAKSPSKSKGENKKPKKNYGKATVAAVKSIPAKVKGEAKHIHNDWSIPKKIIASLITILVIIVLTVGIYSVVIISKAPDINPNNIYSYISEQSTIYDDHNRAVDNVFVVGGHRSNVKYKDIPQKLIDAVVSIEDKKFWKHHGFNFVRVMGAIKDSVFGGGQVSGTSTITQQLARNVFLKEEMSVHSMKRKIVEAYYTVLIEKNLSKEQIMEAYLNTVYFGYDSYGVKNAAARYFNKPLKKLSLLECAALAALPQQPDTFSLVKVIPVGKASKGMKNLLAYDSDNAYMFNGEPSETRRQQTLNNMCEEGYIKETARDWAKKQDLRKSMHINIKQKSYSSYFVDFCIGDVIDDLMDKKGYSYEKAHELVYTGGLKILTKMNRNAQKVISAEFANQSNFPQTINVRKDAHNNILDNYGNVILLDYNNYFDSKKRLIIRRGQYVKNSGGSVTFKKGYFLNFYEGSDGSISIVSKSMYAYINGVLCTIESANLTIPPENITIDAKGNATIDAEFVKANPNCFRKVGSALGIGRAYYTIKQPVKQPQSAMVVIDNNTGALTAMVGGRNITGKMLYNRAEKARQPGSSIKPLAIYSSALQMGADAAKKQTPMVYKGSDTNGYGSYITASSLIHDAPIPGSIVNGDSWPHNWYSGYKGYMTLRKSVEQSVNVNAVRLYNEVGPTYATSQLKKFGITSVDEEGSVSDQNPAALALGGMTTGISPLELASAYTTFVTGGIHKEYTAYTEVRNSKGETILKPEQKKTRVLDKGVAFVMQDILRTTVTQGLGKNASLSNAQVGGKTGTTSDNYDMWFAGFTKKYSAALWWGNDYNFELTGTSDDTARLWGNIMGQICAGGEYQTLPTMPEGVFQSGGEYYVDGTR